MARAESHHDLTEAPPAEQTVEQPDQRALEIFYLQKQLAVYEDYQKMIGQAKDTTEYKEARAKWMQKRETANKAGEAVRKVLSPEEWEKYQTDYNFSLKKARARLEELGGALPGPDKEEDVAEPKTSKSVGEVERLAVPPKEKKGSNAWMGIWDVWTGGHLPEDVSEDDIKRYVKRVAKSQGKNTLAYAYAENLLKNFKEKPARQEAEEHRQRVEERERELKETEKRLKEKKEENEGILDQPLGLAISRLSRSVKEAQDKRDEEKKKASWGQRFKVGVKRWFGKFKKEKTAEEKKEDREREKEAERPEEELGPDKTKDQKSPEVSGGSFLGFLKERAQGFALGFGWWEIHQAEKFRRGTKKAGRETEAQTKLLEQEAGLLDLEGAWEEALEVESKREAEEKDWIENYGADPQEARRLAVEFLSAKISNRKREYNRGMEDKIVSLALKKLEDGLKNKSWFEQYKAAYGGAVITSEKMQAVEKRMREEIGKIRRGQLRQDLVNFIKLNRQNLDKRYWHRYIYGALDALGAFLGWKYIISPWLGGKAAEAAAGAAAGVEGARETAKRATETGLVDTIWAESRRLLESMGVSRPDNQLIQEVAETMSKESGVEVVKQTGENLWPSTAGGAAKDIALQKGFILQLGKATQGVLEIKARLGL